MVSDSVFGGVYTLPENEYHHDYVFGRTGRYLWLRSNHFRLWDALSLIPPPKEGFRTLYAPYFTPELAANPQLILTPIMYSWPDTFAFGRIFILPSEIASNIHELQRFNLNLLEVLVDDNDPAVDIELSRCVNALHPLFFFCQSRNFWMATRNRKVFEHLINSERFTNTSERRKAELESSFKEFADAVGPEVGPESCVETDCHRLRIRFAVRCVFHQYVNACEISKKAMLPS